MEGQGLECRIVRAEELLSSWKKWKSFEHLTISAMSMDIPAVKRIAKNWRRLHTAGRILIGGPIAFEANRLLRETRADALVIGEGEGTLEELIREGFFSGNIDLSSVDGIAYRENGRTVTTKRRPYISENELSERFRPSVNRIVDYQGYEASRVYVETVRGCSNFNRTKLRLPDGRVCSECGNCESEDSVTRLHCPEDIPPGCGFCSVPATWGPPRSRNEDEIVNEVRDLLSIGVHRIVLEAPGFLDYRRGDSKAPLTHPCNPPPNLDAISSLLKELTGLPEFENGLAHITIENIKACLFTEEVAETLSKFLGDVSPNIGLETGSERHSTLIGKCGGPQLVVDAVRIAAKHGMHPFVYFIYGLPGEDEESLKGSLRIMNEVSNAGAERIILYGFRPLPNSAFEEFRAPTAGYRYGQILKKQASEINRSKKRDYLGKTVRGIAAEPSSTHHGFTMVYPLGEGPLMTVRGGYSSGSILDVRITQILSPGLLKGEVERTPNEST
jgi:radical SAM superfamily enzyme YgiQ (UPF0313 family)